MPATLDPEKNSAKRTELAKMETYVSFRAAIPKPTSEEAHIRHILRYYVARSLLKSDYEDVYILPDLEVDGVEMTVDVAARKNGGLVLAYVEPESVTDETVASLEALRQATEADVIIVHSQYGDAGAVPERFPDELESGRYRLMAVVPPPFDDVYEYDIWMFETTFRNVLGQ